MTGRCGARGALNASVALAAGGSQRAPAAAGTHRPGVARGRQSTSGLPSDALIELDSGAGWAWGSQSPPLASGRSHHGGPQAGAMRGGAVGSPTWRRMSRMVDGSVMKAMIRISAPQREHTSGNASCIRASSSANAQRAPRRGAGAAAGVVPCGVGATAAHRKVPWRPRTAGFGREPRFRKFAVSRRSKAVGCRRRAAMRRPPPQAVTGQLRPSMPKGIRVGNGRSQEVEQP